MKKTVLYLSILLLATISPIQAQETDPKMAAFLEKIDGASLEELEAELDEGIAGLKSFMGFFQAPENDTKTFTAEEERFSAPFAIDTSIVESTAKQFDNIGFIQVFKESKSFLKFHKIGDDYWSKASLTEGMEESLTPTKIHFKDGTSSTSGINTNKTSFFWEEEWGDIKVIDSVEIDYTIRYTKAYDSLRITKKTKKLKYRQGIVKVERLEKNHLYITISDAYSNGLYLRALNSNGEPLSENSSSSSPTSDEESGGNMAAMLSLLEDVQGRLKKNKFKDVAQLKKYLLKQVSKIKETKDTDEVSHKKFYFNGNIDTVMLYFETEANSLTVPFTAVNKSRFREILLYQDKEHITFMDAQAKDIFQIDVRPFERIGNRLFVEDETYLYVNMATKSLDSLEAVKVFETSNGLIFVQEKIESGFVAHDAILKQLSNLEFSNVWSIDDEYAHTIGHDKENYAIDSKGTIKKIEGVDDIGELAEGLLIAKLNGKYGFIDVSGKNIVPCIYKDAELFSEGLAVVMNEEGQYGFVDKKGEITLPLVYNRANSFENGIALVSKDRNYVLIDKTGKILVKSDSSGYSMNGSGIQKTYQFGDKIYDAFGKLISKNK